MADFLGWPRHQPPIQPPTWRSPPSGHLRGVARPSGRSGASAPRIVEHDAEAVQPVTRMTRAQGAGEPSAPTTRRSKGWKPRRQL
jgi:hypothetical protein